MPTAREVLLASTILSSSDTHIAKLHIQSTTPTVIAKLGGAVEIEATPDPVMIATNTTEVVITPTDQKVEILQETKALIVDGTKVVQIVIDPDC